MDTVLQAFIFLAAVPCALIAIKKTRSIINPVTLMIGLFFVPMFFAAFRLSGLQSSTWDYETYVALICTIGTWLIIPTLAIALFYKKATPTAPRNREAFLYAYRSFSLLVISFYFLGNHLQAGMLLPIFHPEVAFAIHDEFPGGVRFFARATPAAAVLSYLAFYHYRRKIDVVIFLALFLTPLSRLSRIDPAITIIAIALIYPIAPLFKQTLRNYTVIAASLIALLLAGSELGNQRQNRFGEYEFKYAEMIKWKPEAVGPSEVWPVLYGYTALSFENLDATIASHNGRFTYVLYSFDWLYSGFLKLNWITPYERARYENFQREIISGAATVPTALFPFYKDFGPIGLIIPTLLYMGVLLIFYTRTHSSTFVALYGLYAGAFGLASFQALVAASPIIQQLVWILLICAFANRSSLQTTKENANSRNTSQLA
ncbi:oligosaccharide repeat unit polymerase [Aquabacterium fontiphilum]|uniref:O-antigen polymerase n=1 Tax=Aquabacterium fontiphilum TaxID=450365 RepID=UPI0013775E8E|nr:O-antigen polymerase [Aquabacterium fontiphilum]NBD22214.1 oligosaccharide repeat unit polymerase [Aquabacterium fontiphilum]